LFFIHTFTLVYKLVNMKSSSYGSRELKKKLNFYADFLRLRLLYGKYRAQESVRLIFLIGKGKVFPVL